MAGFGQQLAMFMLSHFFASFLDDTAQTDTSLLAIFL
jgi:hypothetical protein